MKINRRFLLGASLASLAVGSSAEAGVANRLKLEIFHRSAGLTQEIFVEPGATSFVWPSGVIAIKSIECYAEGGLGATSVTNTYSGGGAGGGGWAALGMLDSFNANPGDVLSVSVGTGAGNPGSGVDTWIKDRTGTTCVLAPRGLAASANTGGPGGGTAAAILAGGSTPIGTFSSSGGTGGNGVVAAANSGGATGGGAAGPDGNGGNGGSKVTSSGGPGGAGANGGSSGTATSSSVSTAGAANRLGYGRGPTQDVGINGGGGGGGAVPGAGSMDPIWADGKGPSGSPGGATSTANGRDCTGYGAGGGGGGCQTGTGHLGAKGAPGRIRIVVWIGAPNISGRIYPGLATGGAWPALSQPADQGTGPLSSINAIGGFLNFSYDTVTGDYLVDVFAYHVPTAAEYALGKVNNMARVDFYANGGPAFSVSTVTIDGTRGDVPVYRAVFRPGDLPYGRLVEIRAILYPTTGRPLILQGNEVSYTPALFIYADPGSGLSPQTTTWIDGANGSDTTGDGSEANPWATLSKAKSLLPAGGGSTIYLQPYLSYAWGAAGEAVYTAVRNVIISGAPGTTRDQINISSAGSNGMNLTRWRAQNLSFSSSMKTVVGTVNLENCYAGPGASFGGVYRRSDLNCYYENCPAVTNGGGDWLRINTTFNGTAYEPDQLVTQGIAINFFIAALANVSGTHGDTIVTQEADTINNMIAFKVVNKDANTGQCWFGGGVLLDSVVMNCDFAVNSGGARCFQRDGTMSNVASVANNFRTSAYWRAANFAPLRLTNFFFIDHVGTVPTILGGLRQQISGAVAATGVFTQLAHNFDNGVQISLTGMAGGTWSTLNGGAYLVVVIDVDTYTLTTTGGVPISTSGLGTYTPASGTTTGGNIYPVGITTYP